MGIGLTVLALIVIVANPGWLVRPTGLGIAAWSERVAVRGLPQPTSPSRMVP
jgi:hypothetical protein